MCGVAGIVSPLSTEVVVTQPSPLPDQGAAERLHTSSMGEMVEALRHRGPDGYGTWAAAVGERHIEFGHTRLAILDLSDAAKQPMVDAVSGCVLVYNGEIYNFRELRAELLRDSASQFISSGDTEVILRGYLRWGMSVVRRLRGMFAFAIYDPRVRQLVLARDNFGIKPLYVTEGSGGKFAFASEVRALLSLPWVRRSVDPFGLKGYLAYGSVQEPYTLVSGIRSVPPGHTLTVDVSGDELVVGDPESYWELPEVRSRESKVSVQHLARQIRDGLAESVRLHMISDVPVGVFLSGGIDSSAVIALMAEAAPSEVHALTVSFQEADFDESEIARSVACRYASRHTDIPLTADDLLPLLPEWLESQDQPSADGANAWVISRVCKEAGLTVALSGLGGDELFGGYPTFQRAAMASRAFTTIAMLPNGARRRLAKMIRATWCQSTFVEKLAEWVGSDGSDLSTYLILRAMFLPQACAELLDPWVTSVAPTELHPGVLNKLVKQASASPDTIAAIGRFEMSTYLHNTLLRDSDQMGMAHSLEIRVPFVDRDLANLAAVIPGFIHTKSGPKTLLRAAMGDSLDRAWMNRPKKCFAFPWDHWLRNGLRKEVEPVLMEAGEFPFRPGAVGQYWQRFLQGDKTLNASRMLTLYALVSWIRRHRLEVVQ